MKGYASHAVVQWGLPVAVAGGAVALHFALHVPRGEYEPRPSEEAPGIQPAGVASHGGGGFRPRRPVRLNELRRELAPVPFDEEPLDDAFARAHEGLLSRAIGVARAEAFEGAPDVPEIETELSCRTLRCRVDVCSPFPAELDLLAATLQSLRAGQEPLFHRIDVEPTTRGALGKEPPGEPCFRIVVSFQRDLPARDAIRVALPGERDLPGEHRTSADDTD